MPRPTARQEFENRCRRIVEEIWEKAYRRSKDELIFIGFQSKSVRESNFINIRTERQMMQIHKSSFENYFNAKTKEQQESCRDNIKKVLESLI